MRACNQCGTYSSCVGLVLVTHVQPVQSADQILPGPVDCYNQAGAKKIQEGGCAHQPRFPGPALCSTCTTLQDGPPLDHTNL